MNIYSGFEQGPIRPPSEASSLLIRVTRNCPWNRCVFCPVYKGQKFSRRSVDEVINDIDAVAAMVDKIFAETGGTFPDNSSDHKFLKTLEDKDMDAYYAAVHWINGGMESLFLQDANSLILKTEDLVTILNHINKRFPFLKRITSYARSVTIDKKSDDEMKAIADAGLKRIHIGMESGSDNVLEMIDKGATRYIHVKAGVKVKKAGISLSEYVMPGLGGKKYSHEHAVETASALNSIEPDFIRIRTLAILENTPLYDLWLSGKFEKISDMEAAKELKLFIENLKEMNSFIVSDHILNLFEDINGNLKEMKADMLSKIESFFSLSPQGQIVYQLGRRTGLFKGVDDMKDISRYSRALSMSEKLKLTPDNVDHVISEMMKRFV